MRCSFSCPSRRVARFVHVLSLGAAGAIFVAGVQLAAPAYVADAEAALVAVPVNIDADAVAAAAVDFGPGSAADAAKLAEAAATLDAVPVEQTRQGMVAETETGKVKVDKAGEATISAEGMPEIGVAVLGDAESVNLVDGDVVQTEVAPSTDVVTRATEDGVQMIAILGDESAPSEIEFPLDLSDGGELIPQEDGSILVVPDLEPLMPTVTDEGIGKTKEFTGPVALIEPAWAFDANGEPIETEYVIDGDTITQVVHTDDDTAFPVVADPTFRIGAVQYTVSGFSVGWSGVKFKLTMVYGKDWTKKVSKGLETCATLATFGGLAGLVKGLGVVGIVATITGASCTLAHKTADTAASKNKCLALGLTYEYAHFRPTRQSAINCSW